MRVLKFGGTSVANAPNIKRAMDIIRQSATTGKTIVVVSALGGITDILLNSAQLAAEGNTAYEEILEGVQQRHLDAVKELLPVTGQSALLSWVIKTVNELKDTCQGIFLLKELTPRAKDRLVSFGEYMSSRLVAEALCAMGVPTGWKDSRELIITNAEYTHAAVDFNITNKNITNWLQNNTENVWVLPGFIAATAQGITSTLGRGGSDYTAAIMAAAANATALEIWTDVSGMMTADPRLTANARIIPEISYQEAMELSHFGAKVIYPPTIQPVMQQGVPTWIKNTFSPNDAGTIITKDAAAAIGIRGISSIGNIALLSLEGAGMIGVPGFSMRLFQALSQEKINVILITQGSSEHSICVGIDAVNAEKAQEVIDHAFEMEIMLKKVNPVVVENELSIVALVGENMRSHPGISGRMFGTLGKNGVNIRAIAQGSSERNISAVIGAGDVRKAINILHEAFFETDYKQVNLFISGVGNVGKKLLRQLLQQQEYLQQQMRLQVRVVGLSNSRLMVFNEQGINLENWQQALEKGTPANPVAFAKKIIELNLRNTIFADITAEATIADIYTLLLEKSISVVACNKIAASSPFAQYRKLKNLARDYNCQFLFETNVGAGLPVIATLNDLLHSGDVVHKIEAVLSGTLNFIFNNYNGETPFADIVKQAQDEGYTEPDPRIDLGGTDVMRKILILAREANIPLEMEGVSCNGFLPAHCFEGTVADFYEALKKEEALFQQIHETAKAEDKKLKFVAVYEKGKAQVGLQHIAPDSPFYHLYGKDNAVLFHTERYAEQPLVVKGAGAGAEVTAAGVFADIMRAAR
jgi:bifunctional aspartokinase / homoserine dehydrogenase 1